MTLDRLGRWRLPVLWRSVDRRSPRRRRRHSAARTCADRPGRLSVATRAVRRRRATHAAPGDTPESAVRAFFEAFARARENDDPSLIEPYVTGTDSSAYQTAAGFLEGQTRPGQGLGGHGSANLRRSRSTLRAAPRRFSSTLREGGYDIDLDTGEPFESPVVLPDERVQATLVAVERPLAGGSYGAVQ